LGPLGRLPLDGRNFRNRMKWFHQIPFAMLVVSFTIVAASCEKRRPVTATVPKAAVHKFGSTVEECRELYRGHAVVMLVNSRWDLQGAISAKLLESPEVAVACLRYHAVLVEADMSTRVNDLDKLLTQHGEAGVPYLAIYPADRLRAPYIGHGFMTAEGIVGDINAALGAAVP